MRAQEPGAAARPSDRAGVGVVASGEPPLVEHCRACLAEGLAAVVDTAVAAVEDALFKRADRANGFQQQTLLDAMVHLRECRGRIAGAFSGHYRDVFDERTAGSRPTFAPAPHEAVAPAATIGVGLALIDDAELASALAVGTLAQRSFGALDAHLLFELRSRVADLLDIAVEDDERNPVLPAAVFEALARTCAELAGSAAERQAALEAFEPFVSASLGEIYEELNQTLLAGGVLPDLRPAPTLQPRGAGGTAAGEGEARAGGSGGSGSARAVEWRELLGAPGFADATASLAQALAPVLDGPPETRRVVVRLLAHPAAHGFEAALATPPTPALVDSLDRIQSSAPPARTSSAALVARIDPRVREKSHPLDLLTVEFVALVFEKLLDDKSIPAPVRAELARLQIVAIKAALLDRRFFASRSHPMRRLLDRIAETATDVELDTGPKSLYVAGLRSIVNGLTDRFKNDFSIFTRAIRALDRLVERIRESIDRKLDAYSREVERRERVELATMGCAAEINRRLQPYVPDFMRDFLTTTWLDALVRSHGRDDDARDSYKSRLDVIDVLVWSVAALSSAQIRRLATVLPPTVRRLTRGMNEVGMPETDQKRFFKSLMKEHLESIERAKSRPAEGGSDEGPTAPAAPAESAPRERDRFDRIVAALRRGALLDLAGEGGAPRRVVVSWVSASRRTIVLNAEPGGPQGMLSADLAEELRSGRARIVSRSGSVVDRIVTDLARPARADAPAASRAGR